MALKNAASLALIGTVVLTILMVPDFINTALNVVSGLIPSMALLRSLIHLVASLTVAVFFFAFNREQSG